jgi:Lar family restriction alleviation protein
MTKTAELLPCPFCGNDELTAEPETTYVMCHGCDADGPMTKPGEAVKAWNTRAAAEDVSAVAAAAVLPELTSDLREILGRPNFTCHFIAKALRLMGFDIPQKSEEEQAVTIYWMLGHYLRDPVNWRDAASAELKASMPEPPDHQ